MTEQGTIRVLLVDDHPVIRSGLRYFVATTDDIAVVGEAANGVEALSQVAALQPDVVVMDMLMPELDGISTIRLLCQRHPAVRVLALTSFHDGDLVQGALQAGACGYLFKDIAGSELAAAIRTAAAGRVALADDATEALIRAISQPPKPGSNLSEREIAVLAGLADGYSNEEIAGRLVISRNTVRHHVHNILAKLGVTNRTEAVALALQHGIVGHVRELGSM